ncbi:hypothetical protein Pyn_14793 [Prunus yedoensis var. nudiflora]|uniref:Uncharacterized protein n=1 Tax=Prunus yedoensis var. nudiflora TaxID=2094558 RepID=A0A314YW12_PRUYE|nr:hypothetical protein Pyn_14793 [Prunus yedoensis var. nudiflora]
METHMLNQQPHATSKEIVNMEVRYRGVFKVASLGCREAEVGPKVMGRIMGLSHQNEKKEQVWKAQDFLLWPTNKPTRNSDFGVGLRNKWVDLKSPTSESNLFTRFGQNKSKGKGLARVSPSKFGNQREKVKEGGSKKQIKRKGPLVLNHFDKESVDGFVQEEGFDEEEFGFIDGTQKQSCDLSELFLEKGDQQEGTNQGRRKTKS